MNRLAEYRNSLCVAPSFRFASLSECKANKLVPHHELATISAFLEPLLETKLRIRDIFHFLKIGLLKLKKGMCDDERQGEGKEEKRKEGMCP
jgi:hypothetical protein